MILRRAAATLVILAALLAGWTVGRASDRDETSLTVRVSSSDHEISEGYFRRWARASRSWSSRDPIFTGS